jgi:hypothetical protein
MQGLGSWQLKRQLIGWETGRNNTAGCSLFVCSIFNDTFSVTHIKQRRMTNWKGCGRKRSWPDFKVLSHYLPGGADENRKKPQPG